MPKRSYVWRDNQLIEITPEEIQALPQVMDDVQDFTSTDGANISGRRQWREHLKRTGSREMGHADLRNAQENWQKRRASFAERVNRDPGVRPVEAQVVDAKPEERSRLNSEIQNKLYNRPSPDRKTLVQLVLREARELAKRK